MKETYFITGGCGFIGSNFIHYLFENDLAEKIINLDLITYAGNPKNNEKYDDDPRYVFVQGNITDAPLVKDVLSRYSPQKVVHFAAESHVDRSIDGPLAFVDTNVVGTGVLLQEAKNYYFTLNETQKKDFLFHHVSTDEVYGSLGNEGFFTEETPYDPSSPYSASKASSDHLVRAWYRTYGMPIKISNCSNNYGPYQFPEKLIPLMILNCLSEKPLPVYGKGENIRDWLYVEDHCDAIYTIIKTGISGETYNVGGNNEIQNIKIVKTICEILDELKPRESGVSYTELITYVKDRPGHDFRYAIDSSKLMNVLDWKPKESFETGIRKTIQWYLSNREWWEEIKKINYKQERLGKG